MARTSWPFAATPSDYPRMDAKRRRFDVLVCWRLDRLGRNLRHLVVLLEDLQTVGVSFVSLAEGIDCTTPAGKLQLHILAALAEFERAPERSTRPAGLMRAKRNGVRLGRPRRALPPSRHRGVSDKAGGPTARRITSSTVQRWFAALRRRAPMPVDLRLRQSASWDRP